MHVLTRLEQDAEGALRALADALGAPKAAMPDPRAAAAGAARRAKPRRAWPAPSPR